MPRHSGRELRRLEVFIPDILYSITKISAALHQPRPACCRSEHCNIFHTAHAQNPSLRCPASQSAEIAELHNTNAAPTNNELPVETLSTDAIPTVGGWGQLCAIPSLPLKHVHGLEIPHSQHSVMLARANIHLRISCVCVHACCVRHDIIPATAQGL